MRPVAELDRQILSSAQGLFLRYGPKRTSMDDIAQAAGVSKPTIYAHIGGKEEVFRAVILNLLEGIRQQSRAAAATGEGVVDTVTAVLLSKFGLTLELSVNTQHLDELVEAAYTQAPDESHRTEADFDAVILEVLTRAQDKGEIDLSRGPVKGAALVDSLKIAAIGSQQTATDLGDMRQRLTDQVTLLLAGYRKVTA
jgi:TetR/AcrR family transcriptional regulator, mexJK operon transcriptional repressor